MARAPASAVRPTSRQPSPTAGRPLPMGASAEPSPAPSPRSGDAADDDVEMRIAFTPARERPAASQPCDSSDSEGWQPFWCRGGGEYEEWGAAAVDAAAASAWRVAPGACGLRGWGRQPGAAGGWGGRQPGGGGGGGGGRQTRPCNEIAQLSLKSKPHADHQAPALSILTIDGPSENQVVPCWDGHQLPG